VREAWSPGGGGRELLPKNVRQRGIHSAVVRGRPLTKNRRGNLAPSPSSLAAPACGGADHLRGTVQGIAMPLSRACHSLPDVTIELLSINAQRSR
jgi:hypothetical protein